MFSGVSEPVVAVVIRREGSPGWGTCLVPRSGYGFPGLGVLRYGSANAVLGINCNYRREGVGFNVSIINSVGCGRF